MKATVRWIDGASFLGESGSGHTVTIDGPPGEGGRNMGIRPMEMVLLGVAGCSSFDVMAILRKARQPVRGCVVHVEAERAGDVPAVFTHIHLHFVITGTEDLKESQVKRAITLSADKYCSASIMMARSGANVTHDYRIVRT